MVERWARNSENLGLNPVRLVYELLTLMPAPNKNEPLYEEEYLY